MALALYRKYRPRTFAEVIGQEHVTEPLSQALRSGRLHHAYLFSGPRGCGKTSSARILARSLNCEQGPTPEPCGHCLSCRSLANDGAGSIDVIEIDAASHGGVDDARELREKAFFAPANSRFKIYVIDEAHMVSPAGFNALLKLVEEPPEYVKFIFATTEPEKVLGTIRSRTHHYPFRLIPPATLRPYLAQLCEAEGVHVDPAVFPLVVRAGGGSARDTLSVLDQLIAGAGPEGVAYARAVTLLGVTDVALIDEMCDALAAGDGAAAYATIDRVAEAGHDPRRFASDLLERLRDLIVLQQVPDAVAKGLIDGPADQMERMVAQSGRLGPATLSRCADIVHNGLVEMRGTTAPRLLLELITARMLLPGAEDSTGALLQRLERMERRLALGADPAGSVPHQDPGVRATPAPAAPPSVAAPPSATAAPGTGGIAAARAVLANTRPSSPPPAPPPPPAAAAAPAPGSTPAPAVPASVTGPVHAPAAPDPAFGPGSAFPSASSPDPASATMPGPAAEAPAAAPQAGVSHGPGPVLPDPAAVMPDAPLEPGVEPVEAGAAGQLSAAAIRETWPEIVTMVGRRSKKVAALASGAVVRDLDGKTVVLTFRFPAHARMVAAQPELLSDALYETLGGRWQIRCEVSGDGGGAVSATRPAASPGPATPPAAAPNSPAQSGPAQSGPAQSGPAQSGPARPGPAQPGPAQSGSAQSGSAQSGLAPSGLAPSGPARSGESAGATPQPRAVPPGGAPELGAAAGGAEPGRPGGEPGRPGGEPGRPGGEPGRPGGGPGSPAGRGAGPSGGVAAATGGPGGGAAPVGTAAAVDDWPEPARPGGLAPSGGAGPAAGGATRAAAAPVTVGHGSSGGSRTAGSVVAGGGLAAARAAAAGAGAARAAASAAWSDGSPAEEPPYDPEYDGPVRPGAAPAAAPAPAYEGFDPGDEPLDDVIDEKTARQSSEQQAMQLLRDAFGAEKIGEV